MIRELLYRLTHVDTYHPAVDGGMVRISEHLRTGTSRTFHSPAGPTPVWREIGMAELVDLLGVRGDLLAAAGFRLASTP